MFKMTNGPSWREMRFASFFDDFLRRLNSLTIEAKRFSEGRGFVYYFETSCGGEHEQEEMFKYSSEGFFYRARNVGGGGLMFSDENFNRMQEKISPEGMDQIIKEHRLGLGGKIILDWFGNPRTFFTGRRGYAEHREIPKQLKPELEGTFPEIRELSKHLNT